MNMFFLMNLTVKIICFSVVLDSLETLKRRKIYSKDGLYAYYLNFQKKNTKIHKILFSDIFIPLVLLKLAFSCLLLFYQSSILLTLVLLLQIISFIRHKSGNSAAEQMQIIVLAGALIFSLNISDLVNQCSLYFIAVQATISYVTAGYHKLISRTWRSGDAILLVMGTESYGHIPFFTFLKRNKVLPLVLSWSTILFDFTFIIALFFPTLAIVYLILGVIFHAANAYFMGLNMFLYVYAATYPCVLFSSIMIYDNIF
jgi:hypothetical protein